MSANTSKPKNAVPVIVLRADSSRFGRYLIRLLPALFGSIFFHIALVVLFGFFLWIQAAPGAPDVIEISIPTIMADQVEVRKETFDNIDIDPNAEEYDLENNNRSGWSEKGSGVVLISILTYLNDSRPNSVRHKSSFSGVIAF